MEVFVLRRQNSHRVRPKMGGNSHVAWGWHMADAAGPCRGLHHSARSFPTCSVQEHIKNMPGGFHANMKRWEPAEDLVVLEMLGTIGPRWSKISKALPGRSIPSIRNRWQRIDKGHKRRDAHGGGVCMQCPYCGEPKNGHECLCQLLSSVSIFGDLVVELAVK